MGTGEDVSLSGVETWRALNGGSVKCEYESEGVKCGKVAYKVCGGILSICECLPHKRVSGSCGKSLCLEHLQVRMDHVTYRSKMTKDMKGKVNGGRNYVFGWICADPQCMEAFDQSNWLACCSCTVF